MVKGGSANMGTEPGTRKPQVWTAKGVDSIHPQAAISRGLAHACANVIHSPLLPAPVRAPAPESNVPLCLAPLCSHQRARYPEQRQPPSLTSTLAWWMDGSAPPR